MERNKLQAGSGSAIFCAGCNERFRPAEGSAACPRCGADVRDFSEPNLAETLLIHKTRNAPGDDVPHEPDAEALDQLVGRDLHVYRCESLLGCGGMGRVYLARHRDLDRRCALKILLPQLAARDPGYVSRFRQEGRAAAALVHPNIITAHAIGELEGYHFLEMEFVPGRSLQHLVNEEGRLTPIRSAALVAGIAEGLAAAHREGIVHRDLKPDNVLMTHRGVPKISDFGLAKRIAGGGASVADEICGTPNFMAPELFSGVAASPASDVYALGICFFLLLTGRLPFVAGSLSELTRRVSTEPLPNVREIASDIPLEMAECLSLMTAKSPANRPKDGIEAVQLLHAILGEARDVESLLLEAFGRGGDVSWSRDGQRYTLQLTLPQGRRQTACIEPSSHASTERLLLIYSVCCDARPEFYEEALRLNSQIPHGGLAIREIDGIPKFIMVDTYPRGTVDTEEVRRSLLEVAYRADSVEHLLTGLDHH